jgi:hypothetical protein
MKANALQLKAFICIKIGHLPVYLSYGMILWLINRNVIFDVNDIQSASSQCQLVCQHILV